mmetsp:Transcript_11485/g.30493  ORF Transcript_11485/g.30493 Transcript_11485/m.30493 type:complete len:286 (-) Transcript_11485:271-1128(-)
MLRIWPRCMLLSLSHLILQLSSSYRGSFSPQILQASTGGPSPTTPTSSLPLRHLLSAYLILTFQMSKGVGQSSFSNPLSSLFSPFSPSHPLASPLPPLVKSLHSHSLCGLCPSHSHHYLHRRCRYCEGRFHSHPSLQFVYLLVFLPPHFHYFHASGWRQSGLQDRLLPHRQAPHFPFFSARAASSGSGQRTLAYSSRSQQMSQEEMAFHHLSPHPSHAQLPAGHLCSPSISHFRLHHSHLSHSSLLLRRGQAGQEQVLMALLLHLSSLYSLYFPCSPSFSPSFQG